MTTVRCARRVYWYWREQGFSPADARFMVGAFVFARAGRREAMSV